MSGTDKLPDRKRSHLRPQLKHLKLRENDFPEETDRDNDVSEETDHRNICHVFGHLWIGSSKYTEDDLKREGIVRVISVMDEKEYMPIPNCEHIVYGICDSVTGDIIGVCEKVASCFFGCREPTLVHCFAGKSRSASVCAYLLVKSGRYDTFDAALEYLSEIWPRTEINLKFHLDLIERFSKRGFDLKVDPASPPPSYGVDKDFHPPLNESC